MSYPVISVLSTSPAHCCPDRCWPTAAHLPKAPPTHNLPTPDDATLDPCMPVRQDPDPDPHHLHRGQNLFRHNQCKRRLLSKPPFSFVRYHPSLPLLLLMYNLQWASGDARLVGLPSIKSFIFSARLLHHPRVSVKI